MRLILAGVTVGAFSFAFVRCTFTLEDNLSRMILTWTSADISSARFDQAVPLAFWAAGGLMLSFLMAHSMAAAGPVMFVGLVMPQLCRLWFGPNHRLLVPAVALGGAGLVLLADVVSKLVRFPYETPLGIICAPIGAPYFLYATLRARNMA